MDTRNKIFSRDREARHYDFGCNYCAGNPKAGFEFIIFNKSSNTVRAKVKLDESQIKGLRDSLDICLGDSHSKQTVL